MEKEKLNKSKKTVTGQPRDEIEIRPKDKKLNEAKGKTAVLTFGRMNPPTIGHEVLAQKVIKTARQSSGTPLIFLSHSSDPKKNPLSYEEKVRLAQAAFGRNIVVKSQARTIIEILKQLTGQFDNVKVVVGSDRVPEFKRILDKYNGRDFKFQSVEVVSAGTRDPDAEGVSGMSASKMREAAAKNDKNSFKKGLPRNLKSMADMVFTMVRAGMKLAEELEAEGLLTEAPLTAIQRRKKALSAKRYKSRLKFARKRQSKRMASRKRIARRSARAAIKLMRRRLAGKKGASYSKLTAGEKSAIDKRVQARKGVLKKIAKRLMPRVRRAEIARFSTRKEEFDVFFEKYLLETESKIYVNSLEEVYAMVDRFLDRIEAPMITEKAEKNIIKRSEKTGIEVNELFEAYFDGYKAPKKDETPEQSGFRNMNEFIKEVISEDIERHADKKRIKVKGPDGKTIWRDVKREIKVGESNQKLSPDLGQSDNDVRKRKALELETKGAPKGYHFTRDGKLKKGDADRDGKGGKMLRADPLDKQRSKIPPLPEDRAKITNTRQNKELNRLKMRHARQDAAAKIAKLRKTSPVDRVNEEFESLEELYFKVRIADLPPFFVDANSAGEVKRDLRKLVKRPDENIKEIERQTPSKVRQHFRDMAKGKEPEGEEVDLPEKYDMKKADMGDVVKDFQQSDAPQFKGKSKAKRREMAIAAKLAAEEGGAGEQGTDKLARKYKKDTPGQDVNEMFENFMDGKNPQDKGDSARHGIPKGATLTQLKKIRSSDSASPRKKQLAHWQINMRKGKKK